MLSGNSNPASVTFEGIVIRDSFDKISAGGVTNTRPYPFGAFDILAVNMQPATKNWSEFRFTVAKWLLPRADSPSLMEIHQPVSLVPDDAWTDDLSACLEWYLRGKPNKVLKDIKHPLRFRRVGKP